MKEDKNERRVNRQTVKYDSKNKENKMGKKTED